MQVSVIIPIYNAADYVQQAVESALAQPETAEVILVEDGSQDNSLAVCQKLAAAHPTVHLYRHPDGKNHGLPATRNFAIAKSNCQYIAFLDADDFYLPGRFSVAKELFAKNPEIEGVYEALGEHIENEAAAWRWDKAGHPRGKLTMMTKRVPPEQLFEVLVTEKHGHFHLNCLVVKRAVFEKAGLFDEHLRLHGDMAMIWKMAGVATLLSGQLDTPVAIRRIHEQNRISASRSPSRVYRDRMMCLSAAWRWCRQNLDQEKREVMLWCFLNYAEFSRLNKSWPKWTQRFQRRFWLAVALFRYPLLIQEPAFLERVVPDRIAGFRGRKRIKTKVRARMR